MRISLIIIFSWFIVCLKAQQNSTFPVVEDHYHFNWAAIEKKVQRAIVTKFINQHPGYFSGYRHPESYSVTINDLYPCLHFIDLNNDGLDDVIFSGRSTGEGDMVEVFMHTGSDYTKVFEEMQGIVKMDWENKKIKRLYITNWGCCDDYIVDNKIYAVTYDKSNMPQIKQTYQSANIFKAPKPDSLFDIPFRFEVLNSNYKLRSEPVIDDSTVEHWNSDAATEASAVNYGKGYGNCIALLPENSRGTAIGWKTDNTGRVWWYVEIDAQYALVKNALDYAGKTFSAKTIGWLSSRFVHKTAPSL